MTLRNIGRYEVLRRLGAGGMGQLYLARDPHLDRLVAIKILKDDHQDSDELRQRFLREAQALAKVAHRNVVAVYDFGDADGQHFMAMEYIAGETLQAILKKTPPLPLSSRLSIIEDICAGLEHAHRAGIVHRDVKPANVMVDGEGVVKIVDFGIARHANSEMTLDGMMLGSVNYMSPEQIVGRGVDRRSDIFSTGALLYECIALVRAFPGGLDSGVFHRILEAGHTPLQQVVPDVDAELARIVDKALQRDPAQRYDDIGHLRRDLVRTRKQLEEAGTEQTLVRSEPTPVPSGRTPTPGKASDSLRLAALRQEEVNEHLRRGRQAIAAGDFTSALNHAERAAAVDSQSQAAFDLIDEASARIDIAQARQLLIDAERLAGEGRFDEADNAVGGAAGRVMHPLAENVRGDVTRVRRTVEALRKREEALRTGLSQVRGLLEAARYQDALDAIGNLAVLDPARTETRALQEAAERGLVRQQAEQGLAQVQELIEHDQLDEAERLLASVPALSDDIREATQSLRAALAHRRRERHAVRAAQASLDAGDAEAALTLLVAIPRDQRTDAVATIMAAANRQLQAQQEEARRRDEFERLLIRAGQQTQSGAFDGAAADLDAAERLRVDAERVSRRRADVEAARREDAERRQRARDHEAERVVAAARARFAAGQADAAIRELEHADATHPAVQRALGELREAAREAAAREAAAREAAAREAAAREAAAREAAAREAAAREAAAREAAAREAAAREAADHADHQETVLRPVGPVRPATVAPPLATSTPVRSEPDARDSHISKERAAPARHLLLRPIVLAPAVAIAAAAVVLAFVLLRPAEKTNGTEEPQTTQKTNGDTEDKGDDEVPPPPPIPPPPPTPDVVMGQLRLESVPWATVAVRPLQNQQLEATRFTTPVATQLPEGDYELTFESALDRSRHIRKVTIRKNDPAEIKVTMPGFNADQALDAILGTEDRP